MILNKTIVAQFRRQPHDIAFIDGFSYVLETFRNSIKSASTEEKKDEVRRQEWEFKRWFWSFLENAVPLHTKTIHVTKEQLQNYDVALVVKSLKSFGVEIKEV